MTSPVSIHYIVVDIVVGARTAPTQSEGLVIVMDTLFDPSRARSIPQRRVIERMDAYMARRDYAGAERHLLYWLEEARALRDRRGALTVLNELVGHYRKTGERDKALRRGDEALALLEALALGDAIVAGTTCVNFATALNAFGENEKALALFRRARPLYEQSAAADPGLLGGLYNNMALTCAALGRFDEAQALYEAALARMSGIPNGALESAVTLLNLADLVEARDGMEAGEGRIFELADRAAELLRAPELPRDGYYAYVCEKCAPAFDHYGYFAEAEALREEAERIYAGT